MYLLPNHVLFVSSALTAVERSLYYVFRSCPVRTVHHVAQPFVCGFIYGVRCVNFLLLNAREMGEGGKNLVFCYICSGFSLQISFKPHFGMKCLRHYVVNSWLPLAMSVIQWDPYRKDEAVENSLDFVCSRPKYRYLCAASSEWYGGDASTENHRGLPNIGSLLGRLETLSRGHGCLCSQLTVPWYCHLKLKQAHT